eukprot:4957906-Prymnesium_polylepis.2
MDPFAATERLASPPRTLAAAQAASPAPGALPGPSGGRECQSHPHAKNGGVLQTESALLAPSRPSRRHMRDSPT